MHERKNDRKMSHRENPDIHDPNQTPENAGSQLDIRCRIGFLARRRFPFIELGSYVDSVRRVRGVGGVIA